MASHPIHPLRIRPLVVHTRPEYFSDRQDKLFGTVRPTSFWCKTCGPLLVFPTNWRHFSQLTALEMLFFEGSGKPDDPYKNLSEQINDKLSPHIVSTLGLELRLHWRETNALSPLHHLCPLSPVYPIDKDRYGGERDSREVNVK